MTNGVQAPLEFSQLFCDGSLMFVVFLSCLGDATHFFFSSLTSFLCSLFQKIGISSGEIFYDLLPPVM